MNDDRTSRPTSCPRPSHHPFQDGARRVRRGAVLLSALTMVFAFALSGCTVSTPLRDADAGGAGPAPVTIQLRNNAYDPVALTIQVGTKVTWINTDPYPHTVTPTDKTLWGTPGSGDDLKDWLPQNGEWSFTFTKAGTYTYYCIPHAAQKDGEWRGMVATIVVTEGAVAPGLPAAVAPAMPDAIKPFDLPEIGASAYAVPPPIARTQPAHITFDMTTEEVVAKMADGISYSYWSINEQVPGPMLRVRVGDTVTVRLTNDPASTVLHNIDFHAVTGPGGGAAALNADPGKTAELTFTALNPGLYVYHCAAPSPPLHVGHGMYGLILVEPEGGLPPVDREYYVVQGDFYSAFTAGDKGHHSYDAARAADENPTFVVFNGRVGSLTGDRQLTADVGETVRIYFGVGGPNLVSSFHVIGEIFDRVYPEGSVTSTPLKDIQTTLVPAGGATIVDFQVEVPGNYVLVDHSLNRVLKGGAGILAVSGEQEDEVFTPGQSGSGSSGGH